MAGLPGRETPGSTSRRCLRARSVEQDARNLGPRELSRQVAAFVEQLAHCGPAQRLMQLLRVGTGAGRGHAAARRAVEGVLEAKDLDAQLAWRVLVEDAVSSVGVVVITDAG